VQALIAACDEKLARYHAIADAGGDPATIAGWMAETSPSDIERLVASFDHIRRPIRQADAPGKGEVYRQLRLTLTYHPANSKIRVVAAPDADSCGVMVRVRGGT
jgi:site-specific DNA recombinase